MAGPRRARRGVRRRFPPAAVHRCRLGERGRAARPARRPRPDAAGRPSRHPGVPGRRRRAAAAGCVGGPRARPHRLLLRSRVRAGSRRGAARPATRRGDRDRRPRRHRAPVRGVDACRPATLRPRRRGGVLHGPGLHAPPDPDGLALPRPRDPRRRAAHRVQPGRRRARDRRHRRAGDPRRIPAARAPPPDRRGSDVVEPPAAGRDRAGTVGGPGRRRWDGSCAGRSKFRDRRYWPSRGVPPGWRARRPCPAERARWCSPPASRSPCG